MASEIVAPSQAEISEAIDASNASLIAQYAILVQTQRNALAESLPSWIEAASNAKRDLDVCKAQIKHCDETVRLLQSVLRTVRP